MATREDTEEQAELHFTRSMSSRGRYDTTGLDEDEDAVDEEFEATLNNLIGQAKNENSTGFNNTNGTNDETEEELLILKPSNCDNRNENCKDTDAKQKTVRDSAASSNPYTNPLCKPVVSVGKTSIGYSQAKMLGLCDNNGNGKIGEAGLPATLSESTKKRIGNLCKPREIDVDLIMQGVDDEEAQARREAKRAAEKAKRNPHCGYDFVSRLEEQKTGFMDRLLEESKRLARQKQREGAEADYNARLDKLGCPSCRRLQSFDEFEEKRRTCPSCRVKYTKLNICNGATFEKRMKAAQQLREEKLANLDTELYGRVVPDKKFVVGVGLVSLEGDNHAKLSNPEVVPGMRKGDSSALGTSGLQARAAPVTTNLLKTIADSNNARTALMKQHIEKIAQPPADPLPSNSKGANNRRPQSANGAVRKPASGSAQPKEMTEDQIRTMKFNKLTLMDHRK